MLLCRYVLAIVDFGLSQSRPPTLEKDWLRAQYLDEQKMASNQKQQKC